MRAGVAMNQSTRPMAPCPLCGHPRLHFDRYPLAVCQDCASKATDQEGHHLGFYNEDLSGGFKAVVTETGEPYNSHLCFINGVHCYADEARFGGIVIQVQQ